MKINHLQLALLFALQAQSSPTARLLNSDSSDATVPALEERQSLSVRPEMIAAEDRREKLKWVRRGNEEKKPCVMWPLCFKFCFWACEDGKDAPADQGLNVTAPVGNITQAKEELSKAT